VSNLTWLHISDLHFRESQTYDSAIVIHTLLKDLKKRNEFASELKKIDFVFITGDIAYAGQPHEYDLARRFLDELRRVTHVPKSRLFIVPGNHDIDRSLILDEARDILDRLGNRQAVNELLNNSVNRAIVMEGLKNYGQFINDYLGKQLTFDSNRYYYVKERRIANKRVAILGLNSAWASNSNFDQLNLFLGERQVRDAIDKSVKADIRVTLMHHPFSWLRDFDSDSCEPLLLDKGNIILHGHLHSTNIIRQQSPSTDAIMIGAGACYESREFPNSYNLTQIDLITRKGITYIREYSDKDGGFWKEDNTTYRGINGRYDFRLPTRQTNEENMLSAGATIDAVLEHRGKYEETSKVIPAKKITSVLSNIQGGVFGNWWIQRGYKTNPFLFDNVADLHDNQLFDYFQWWYVDPNLPADRNGLGGTPTLEEVKSTLTSNTILVYASSGGGKTFYRRWAARQIEEDINGDSLELTNLAAQLPNPEHVTALDLALALHKGICQRYAIHNSAESTEHILHVLRDCDEKLKALPSSLIASKRVFIFIDDLDQLFEEDNGAKNLHTLQAIGELCRALASQSGVSFALRLFLPLEMKESLQLLLGSKSRQRIQEVTIRWDLDHCESVLEARLDSCWKMGPNTLGSRHLERLLSQDALTELRRKLQGKLLTPGCVIRVLRDLAYYAYRDDVAPSQSINSVVVVKFMKDNDQILCVRTQYPLARSNPAISKPKLLSSIDHIRSRMHSTVVGLSNLIRHIISRLANITDWISAFLLLSLLLAAVLFVFWCMIEDYRNGRTVNFSICFQETWRLMTEYVKHLK
jgi:3',5'-cyclic AMP phosphodiesterase CpdA